jgi:hypothetical protein
MKAKIIKSMGLLALVALSGCATTGSRVAAIPEAGGDVARQQVHMALDAWQQQHDYDTAVMRLEKLSGFTGGGFERARLTALASIHLEEGNRQAFLETANQIGNGVGYFQYLNAQTRYVLTVAWAMEGKPAANLPGRGYDDNRVHAIYTLLGMTTGGDGK